MKKILMLIALTITIFATSGCVTNTVEVIHRYQPKTEFTDDGKEVVADLRAENYVTLLFGFIPILSGRPTLPNAMQYNMWSNTARDHYMKVSLNWYTKKVMKLSGIRDYKSETHFSGWWSLWIVCKKDIIATAKAVK
jgi:hypothetical protein